MRPATYLAPRNGAAGIGTVSLIGSRRTAGDFLKLFLSQRLAHAFRFTERSMNIFVGRSVFEEDHALAVRTLSGISAADPACFVSELRFAPRTAYLNGVVGTHCAP